MFERFSKTARAAVIAASEEARASSSPRVDVEHILLGVLATADRDLAALLDDCGLTEDGVREDLAPGQRAQPLGDEDAEALRSIGIDLDAVRESLAANFGEDALDRAAPGGNEADEPRGFLGRLFAGHIPFTPASKKLLELSLREALAHKDDHIGSAHILLGILRAPNDTTRAIIESHIPPADLRRRVIELLDRAA
jgi:ATP-dependent Clp protease ATP-binding subunit ClpA